MGLSSPLHSVRGYSVSRPPVTVFVICLILCGAATLSMGFFIQYSESILNQEVKDKWLTFLSHLTAVDFCISEGNEEIDVGTIIQIIDGGTLNSTDEVSITVSTSIRLVSELKKLPPGMIAAYGNIEVGDWAVLANNKQPLKLLKMAFVIPPDLRETNSQNSCLILTVPSTFMPLSKRFRVCVPSFLNKTITHVGTISSMKSNSSSTFCKNGAFLKMNYSGNSEDDFYLSKVEKWNIYLRLLHVSYFLFAIAIALICFNFLKTKTYTSVVTVDKMPLTL